jgi:hypothetical protein
MADRKFFSDKVSLALAGTMAVCLVLTLIFGTAAIIWSGQPSGDTTRYVAMVFAWLLTAVFLAAFALAVLEIMKERERSGHATRHASLH